MQFVKAYDKSGNYIGLGEQTPSIANGTWGEKIWDIIEFASVLTNGTDFNVNTSTVESFSIPIYIELFDSTGASVGTTGINKSRADVFTDWGSFTSDDCFKKLWYKKDGKDIRLIAPNQIVTATSLTSGGDFLYLRDYLGTNPGTSKKYLDEYQATLKSYYTASLNTWWAAHSGTGNQYSFTSDDSKTFNIYTDGDSIKSNGGTSINSIKKPISDTDTTDTSSIWGCKGNLECAGTKVTIDINTDIVKKYLAAAFNRGMTSNWADNTAGNYYQTSPYSSYAKFFHQTTISPDGKAYGFSFDDVHGKNPSLGSSTAKTLKISLY
jgi:hypothetical protein